MAKLFKNYIALFIFAFILAALGVISLPVVLGDLIIDLILALALIAYLILFLFDRLSASSGASFVIFLSEFVTIALIAAGLLLGQFKIINVLGVCRVIGLSIWIHTSGVAIESYIEAYRRQSKKIKPYAFAIYLSLSSIGVYMLASPFISNKAVAYIISGISFALSILTLTLGIIRAAKNKTQKSF